MPDMEPAQQTGEPVRGQERWEHGSDFSWPPPLGFAPGGERERAPWERGSLWSTGRDALRALITHRRWRRLWVPSYFCQDVVLAIRSTGVEIELYPDAPGDSPAAARLPAVAAGDAALVVNYFGLAAPPAAGYAGDGEIVEDHSHDPLSRWARQSPADWCFASLRKSLPAPAGAALWSPSGRRSTEPAPVSARAERAAARKLAAMLLKGLYLAGHAISKQEFRELAVSAERELGTGTVSGLPAWLAAMLATFPLRGWRRRRRPNLEAFLEELADAPGVEVLTPSEPDAAPFCAFLTFSDGDRAAAVSDGLIAERIYPARLWRLDEPLVEGVPAAHAALARRSLALHCDHRYTATDMRRVARAVRRTCRT